MSKNEFSKILVIYLPGANIGPSVSFSRLGGLRAVSRHRESQPFQVMPFPSHLLSWPDECRSLLAQAPSVYRIFSILTSHPPYDLVPEYELEIDLVKHPISGY